MKLSKSLAATMVGMMIGICAASLFLLNEAEACGPPLGGWNSVSDISEHGPDEVPMDGAVVIRASDDGGDYDLTMEVQDASGMVIDGTLELMERPRLVDPRSWIHCSDLELTTPYYAIWRPDEPLVEGESYEVTVEAEYAVGPGDDDVEVHVGVKNFTAVGAFEGLLMAPEVEGETLEVVADGKEYECCESEQAPCALCSEDEGRECWYVTEMDRPGVIASLADVQDVAEHQLLYRVLDDNGEIVDFFWEQARDVEVVYPHNHGGPYCFAVEVENLGTGEVESIEDVCVEDDGTVEFGERQLDWSWPDICDDAPSGDDGDDVGIGGDAGDADGEGSDDGGCATAGGGGAPVPVAVLLLMGWGVVRRCEA